MAKKEKLLFSDVIEWIQGVGNEKTLDELITIAQARKIYNKYLDDWFDAS